MPAAGLLAILGRKLLGPPDIAWQPTWTHKIEHRLEQQKALILKKKNLVDKWFKNKLCSQDPRNPDEARELVRLVKACPINVISEEVRDCIEEAFKRKLAEEPADLPTFRPQEITQKTWHPNEPHARRALLEQTKQATLTEEGSHLLLPPQKPEWIVPKILAYHDVFGSNIKKLTAHTSHMRLDALNSCHWELSSLQLIGQQTKLDLHYWCVEELIITDPGDSLAIDVPSHLSSLTLSDKGLDFLDTLPRLPALTKLVVLGVSKGEKSLKVARVLRHFPRLAELTINACESEPELLQALARIRNLELLSLISPSPQALHAAVNMIPRGSTPRVDVIKEDL